MSAAPWRRKGTVTFLFYFEFLFPFRTNKTLMSSESRVKTHVFFSFFLFLFWWGWGAKPRNCGLRHMAWIREDNGKNLVAYTFIYKAFTFIFFSCHQSQILAPPEPDSRNWNHSRIRWSSIPKAIHFHTQHSTIHVLELLYSNGLGLLALGAYSSPKMHKFGNLNSIFTRGCNPTWWLFGWDWWRRSDNFLESLVWSVD